MYLANAPHHHTEARRLLGQQQQTAVLSCKEGAYICRHRATISPLLDSIFALTYTDGTRALLGATVKVQPPPHTHSNASRGHESSLMRSLKPEHNGGPSGLKITPHTLILKTRV